MRLRRERTGDAGLNITPLIDVVFILLVFFMLATNFARYRVIPVDTPQETKVVETAEGAIVVELDDEGGVRFDTDPIEPEMLPEKVAEVIAIDPGRSFLIRPGVGVSLQEAIDMFDAVRAAGATAVSFSPPTEEES